MFFVLRFAENIILDAYGRVGREDEWWWIDRVSDFRFGVALKWGISA